MVNVIFDFFPKHENTFLHPPQAFQVFFPICYHLFILDGETTWHISSTRYGDPVVPIYKWKAGHTGEVGSVTAA
jgi:hypothetical protein